MHWFVKLHQFYNLSGVCLDKRSHTVINGSGLDVSRSTTLTEYLWLTSSPAPSTSFRQHQAACKSELSPRLKAPVPGLCLQGDHFSKICFNVDFVGVQFGFSTSQRLCRIYRMSSFTHIGPLISSLVRYYDRVSPVFIVLHWVLTHMTLTQVQETSVHVSTHRHSAYCTHTVNPMWNIVMCSRAAARSLCFWRHLRSQRAGWLAVYWSGEAWVSSVNGG